jgi:hypothetical protein
MIQGKKNKCGVSPPAPSAFFLKTRGEGFFSISVVVVVVGLCFCFGVC